MGSEVVGLATQPFLINILHLLGSSWALHMLTCRVASASSEMFCGAEGKAET